MLGFGTALIALAIGLAIVLGVWVPLGAAWFQYSPGTLNMLQAGIQRHVSPGLWDGAVLPVLEAPVWVVPAILGAALLLFYALRRRRA